jgi:hypothetical protein
VLQQVGSAPGHLQERSIIDGQQRLTTLQILLDALHAQFVELGASGSALRLERLVRNEAPYCQVDEDKFKVWPTNRDREAFNAVMGCEPPIAYDDLMKRGAQIVGAHRFFSERSREWLTSAGNDQVASRASHLETAVTHHLQMVVIDLGVDENAQEIFETLNARMTPLSAADLIKNLVFQKLTEDRADVDSAYEHQWKDFEAPFWEGEVSVGRVRYQRTAVFLNHWLVAKTGEEIVARRVFPSFKSFAADRSMESLLREIHQASRVYRDFIERGEFSKDPLDRLGLFSYRTSVLESEVVKPLLMALLDPSDRPIPVAQRDKALAAVESWMVRRMLIRASTKNYNKGITELLKVVRGDERLVSGDAITRFLSEQKVESLYWPDDNEVTEELRNLMAYRRLRRGRLRMVLEAVEDYLRGWRDDQAALGSERIQRGTHAIEHIMPRKWQKKWRIPRGGQRAEERDRIIHTIGNLTLLPDRLNSKLSNGPWQGRVGKRSVLKEHNVLFLNRVICELDEWDESAIEQRTTKMLDAILKIWPVPPGHRSDFAREAPKRFWKHLKLIELLNAGVLVPGTSLFPRQKQHADVAVTLLADGTIDVDGKVFEEPSAAAAAIADWPTNGWWFFLVSKSPRRSLGQVRSEYVNQMAPDAEVNDEDEEDDEE